MEKWIDTVGLKGRAKQPDNWRTNTGSLESKKNRERKRKNLRKRERESEDT